MKTGIIGYGKMGGAICDAVAGNLAAASEIYVYDLSETAKSKAIKNGYNLSDIKEICEKCDVVLLAVKPQDIDGVLSEMTLNERTTLISIAAGVKISRIEKGIKGKAAVVRVMPNLAASVRQGVSSVCFNSVADENTKELAARILRYVGEVYEIDEDLMDAVVPYGGSFPAYLYYFLEKFTESAVKNGIERKTAEKMILQAAEGSLSLAKSSGKELSELISDVCSKGGTTIEGIKVFENSDFAKVCDEACEACIKRSRKLSENS
ncbi:MAG TPA: pyrroline-5-carboxylate reductase [Clostridiales bacterium]|nr:pyrroline-5-carboxylate reductase [Clostridiales bacterium]